MVKFNSRKLLAKIAYWYFSFTIKTLRLKSIELVPKLAEQSVYALWHGEQILPLCLNSGLNIVSMCSMSKDGEILAWFLKYFGFIAVRGSSSKGAERALIETIRYARKGHYVAFTVDGPKGPVYKVKPGLLLVSQKLGIRLIPISAFSKHSLIFNKSWDKFKISLPFSKTVIVYGNPIYITKQDNIEEKSLLVEKELNKLKDFTNTYYWSKDVNEYLQHHPKPKIIVKFNNNFENSVNKINEFKQKYPSADITFVIKKENIKNMSVLKNVNIVDKITFSLKKEQFDLAFGTAFFDNLLIKPRFKLS